jgi:hypothetical protein
MKLAVVETLEETLCIASANSGASSNGFVMQLIKDLIIV